MSFIPPLAIGSVITNKQLSAMFKVGNMGGMRRSKATGSLVLICDNTKGLYHDQWHEGRLLYTGMGKIGDQVLEGNQNKTLAESNTNGVKVYLFEVNIPGEYAFTGRVRLAAAPYQAKQPDENGDMRKVWVFPLEKVAEEYDAPLLQTERKIVTKSEKASWQEKSVASEFREGAVITVKMEEEADLQLPPSKDLDIDALSELFSVMNQSYKLFWFRGILEGVRKGKSAQKFGDIVNQMVVDAWYPVVGYHLSLGPADAVERLVLALEEESGLPAETNREAVIAALASSTDPEIKKLKQRLIQFVPYRLLSPFMKSDNWRYWDEYGLTIARINSDPATLYTVGFERSLDTFIQIRPAWMEYLTNNVELLIRWTESKLLAYLKKQNPGFGRATEKTDSTERTDVAAAAVSAASSVSEGAGISVTGYTASMPGKAELVKENKKRKALTPKQKLWRRIKREFPKKKYIGDIPIDDEEFEMLVQELCNQHRRLMAQPEQFEPDEVFCVALVQFGIRFYDDGAYWPFVEQRVNPGYFKIPHRTQFGNAFLEFMKANGKLLNEEKKAMSNILLHGFVSDHKANELFDFLYSYYSIDLARDIEMLNRDAMNALIENIKANDGRKRTYNLVEHTSDAVRLNERGSKTRLRRYLKMIDRAFWNPDEFSIRSGNRLVKRFAEWWSRDEEKIEKDRAGGAFGPRHRSGWKPYLFYGFENDQFYLMMPARLVRGEEEPVASWIVRYGDQERRFDPEMNPAVTGFITDELAIKLDLEEIFGDFELLFLCDGVKLNRWKIPVDRIRFFETDGDYVEPKMLRPGDVVSFSAPDYIPVSDALYNQEEWNGFLRCSYQFEDGDVIIFPDKKVLNIGKKPVEGLLRRGLQDGVFGLLEEKQVPVYAAAPSIFARVLPKSMNGTQLRVNGKVFRLFEDNEPQPGVLVFDLQERASEEGMHIALNQFGVHENGFYHVELDIPNDHADRTRDFLLIEGLEYSYDEAPYIFVETGLLCVPERTGLKAYDPVIREGREEGQLRFAFTIPEEDAFFRLSLDGVPVAFEIPKLSYRFQGEEVWRTKLQLSIWHKDLPEIVEVRYPADRLTILLDEEGNDDEDNDQHSQHYSRNQEKGYFVCDLHPFRSWYGRRVATRRLYVKFPGMKKPARFLNIYTRDVFVSAVLTADLEDEVIHGEFDIIGKDPCFVDLWFEDELLLEKEPIVDGKISLQMEVLSGIYQVDVYDSDTDEDGFDEPDYDLLASKSMELINPSNLTGSHIEVTHLEIKGVDSYLRLKRDYRLYDLKPEKEMGKGYYSGHLVVQAKVSGEYRNDYDAYIHIPDANELTKAYLFVLDEYQDEQSFIYDNDRYIMRKDEDTSVSGVSKYRRFLYLWEDEYVFRIGFVNKPDDLDEKISGERNSRELKRKQQEEETRIREELRRNDPLSVPIAHLGLSVRTYNALSRGGIKTSTDLYNQAISQNGLFRVRNMGRREIEECIIKLRKAGYKI